MQRKKPYFLLFFISLAASSHCLYSQHLDTMRVTVSESNLPLIAFLKEIESSHPVSFYYKEQWFAEDTVHNSFENKRLTDVLDEIFVNRPYLYEVIQDNMVVFLPEEEVAFLTNQMLDLTDGEAGEDAIVIGSSDETGRYKTTSIQGIIKNGKNEEPIVGATVRVENTNIGVVSDSRGKYSLTLRPGIYTILVSSVGFEPGTHTVKVVGAGRLDIELFEKSVQMDEVSVFAQRADRNIRSPNMSVIEMDAKSIRRLPSVVGEKDIIKGMTMLPGVKSIGEFGSGINVRGGGEDQNLYLVEGAPLFNTAHVFGLFSVINPDLVNNVTLYKGHIPAGYGERVSSVMDIRIRDNIDTTFDGRGGIGLYNSRFMLDGPLLNDKITFKVGGRISYSDWLLKSLKNYDLQNSAASFYDLSGLLNVNLKKDRIGLFGYVSKDKFRYDSLLQYGYGNVLGSFDWTHFFNNRLLTSLTIAHSDYSAAKDDIELPFEQARTRVRIRYTSAGLNTNFSGFDNHSIDFGAKLIHYSVLPGDYSRLNSESLVTPIKLADEQAFEGAAYINDVYDVSEKLSINAGIRFSRYYSVGPGKVWQYQPGSPRSVEAVVDSALYEKGDIIKTYGAIEPRLSAKIQFNASNSIKLSYNKSNQYLSLISYSSVPTPDDIWKLSGAYIRPVISNQFAVGYYQNFLNDSIETSVEVYYKQLENLLEYKNDARLSVNPYIETELIDASGRNFGVEVLLRKNSGRLTGWIGYTWSKALKKTHGVYPEEIINDNTYYPSSFDKPHDLFVTTEYQISRRVYASASFTYATGRAITLPEYQYRSGGQLVVHYSDRNKYRLPSYNRLDLSLTIDESLKKNKKWKGRWTISLLNVYARKNVYTVFYRKNRPYTNYNYNIFNMRKLYIIGIPLPTVTYNFIF